MEPEGEKKAPEDRPTDRKGGGSLEEGTDGYGLPGNWGPRVRASSGTRRGCGILGPVVGSYVRKDFADTAGAPLGKVVSYGGRLYGVLYEDGHREELDISEICSMLVEEGETFDVELATRKRKLDQLISAGRPCTRSRMKQNATAAEVSDRRSGASSSAIMSGLDIEEDPDSSSDSCESSRAPNSAGASLEPPHLQALPLPPSSGDIGVPEESVVYLLSTYSFLRSFSHQLFLSPFGLGDFLGSLNCTVHNTLSDAIHVSLLRVLRRHLEMCSSDGSSVALRCLRYLDWNLLDTLTWPVFLVEYLHMMGHRLDRKGWHNDFSEGEYYGLPVNIKLRVLQILCDDVVESTELRTELATWENMDEEREHDVSASLSLAVGVPRRAYHAYSRTSTRETPETLENAAAPEDTNSNSKIVDPDAKAPDVVHDGNCDECRLCGMDGTLICCDGCPSAYHSRCIGLNKAFLPDGLWFCPECMANKTEPTFSRIGSKIRGAEIFGIDPFERVFLGTCCYLLVIETSLNAAPVCRYYNQNDVTKVLQLLCSTRQSALVYVEICKGLSQYWGIPLDLSFSHPERTNSFTNLLVREDAAADINSSITLSDKKTHLADVEGKNYANNITQSGLENKVFSHLEDDCTEAGVNESLDSVDQADPPDSVKYERENLEMATMKLTGEADKKIFLVKDGKFAFGDTNLVAKKVFPFMHTEFQEQIGNESVASVNGGAAYREDADSQSNDIYNGKSREKIDGRLQLGAFFRPQGYVNQYILGDVAASAAANLAVLVSEENRISDTRASSNSRKIMAANIALQVKAFSGETRQFIWPSSEKKLMEIPRERCGWCIACKGPSTSKKGCLLNIAAANAIRGPGRVPGNFRLIKNNGSHIPVIAAHILRMEVSLRGLTFGPFLDANHNKRWCKFVNEASTCRILKFLLLEFERNIRGIAFSGDWTKLVDDWSVDLSAKQASMCFIGPVQKRGPGGRQNRKQSTMCESMHVSCNESCKDFQWWRGGKASKSLFHRRLLPGSLLQKAARLGGSKGISGIHYSEISEIPRRTRQFAWRAAVEMSKNAVQLALQVRYLDAHVRWRDLVCPEQIPVDGKVSENEASIFRNAIIFDKRIMRNKISYALNFGSQKHLPLRVEKNILEVEQSQDGKEKLWFSETHVPLYLIKGFEEKAKEVPLLSRNIIMHCLPEFQRRQLKACWKDIFSYLLQKEENPRKCSCASCRQVVFLRDAVRCNACQGYCHNACVTMSPAYIEDGLEHMCLCNRCNFATSFAPAENCKEILKGQLSFQQEDQIAMGARSVDQNAYHLTQQPAFKMEVPSETRAPPSGFCSERKGRQGSCVSYGLIWKRKKSGDCGMDFRLKHIITRGNMDDDPSRRPVCTLCGKPYNPDLMYISCEKCLNWVHSDAVQLEENLILNLVGFKCCKCRRKTSPKCPHEDPNYRKPERKPSRGTCAEANQGRSVSGSSSPNLAVQTTTASCTNSGELVEVKGKPLPFPSGVDLVAELSSEAEFKFSAAYTILESQQKLPGGTHRVNYGVDVVGLGATREAHGKSASLPGKAQNPPVTSPERHKMDAHGFATMQESNHMIVTEKPSRLPAHPDITRTFSYGDVDITVAEFEDQLGDTEDVNFDDMESEPPQTFFSFTELLPFGDDQGDSLLDVPPPEMSGDWCLTAGFDGTEAVRQEALYQAEPWQEWSTEKHIPASSEAAFDDGVLCHKCGVNLPPPDLACEVCGLRLHSYCSPWLEPEVPPADTPWRCGSCRD